MKAVLKENAKLMDSVAKSLSQNFADALIQSTGGHGDQQHVHSEDRVHATEPLVSSSVNESVQSPNVTRPSQDVTVTRPTSSSNDVSIDDHDRISRAWKTVKTYKTLSPFKGDGDSRSVLEFKNEIESTQSYMFSTTVEKYCFVYSSLAPRVSRQVDYLLKKYQPYLTTFGELLSKVWEILQQEYGNVGDAFNSRMKLMRLCMAPCSDAQGLMDSFEEYTEQFITLADELRYDVTSQSEDTTRLTNRETNAYYLHGLLPQITNKLERDMSPQVLETVAFTELRHRARASVRYMVKKANQGSKVNLGETINFNQGSVAVKYTKAYLSQFRCQRCCSNSHPTFLCKAKDPVGVEARCKVCGLKHENDIYAMKCQARNPSSIRCQRCQGEGHMGRICRSATLNPMTREQRLAIFQKTLSANAAFVSLPIAKDWRGRGLCYVLPNVAGDGFIIPYSLLASANVVWISTSTGESTMVFGKRAVDVHRQLLGEDHKWLPTSVEADGPPTLAQLSEGVESPPTEGERMPFRFIVDEKKLHLLPPDPYLIFKDVTDKIQQQRQVKYRLYRDIWMSRRRESYEKIIKDLDANKVFREGMMVYRWRPRAKMLCVWDGPWRIHKLLGTRALLRLISQDNVQAYESLLNLRPSKRTEFDGASTITNDESGYDHWVECSDCRKWRCVTAEVAQESANCDVICRDVGSDCSEPCDWVTITTNGSVLKSRDSGSGDETLRPAQSFDKSMVGSALLLVNFTPVLKLKHYVGIIQSIVDDGCLQMMTNNGTMQAKIEEHNLCYVIPIGDNMTLKKLKTDPPKLLARALKDVYGEGYTLQL
ncbi:hypothetical protein FOZ63_031335 [Perkinsus olseni]|uniref:CW-type domain-containing protein n=1 Tax=Perkinsus olseni TaxID=32597 RepID=A0A7J6RC92_PEROL|nr:hypothetical protein FOZ62_029539 [Perkinsus olseni]KAF4718294.1 hypothetical protein FOZ63_031335 [Perkinsus olseni]